MPDPTPHPSLTPAEVEAGADEPFTAAELEAACQAVHVLEDMTVDRYLSVPLEVAAAFRAVLPDHDARVRADERARVAEEIAQAIEATDHHPNANCECDAQDAQALAAAVARQHATPPTGEDSDHVH